MKRIKKYKIQSEILAKALYFYNSLNLFLKEQHNTHICIGKACQNWPCGEQVLTTIKEQRI